ncbi:DedA family protein [Sulfurimonas sp. SWIR-19]|uniref:DedA family protein n=1 Tax=Sulfurimonas sp. SWIR-19 TaxID=2878390 RepID=UPI001CF43C06|nr:DedA family protein [Sulfurimonas sp. SWIR-19]UCN00866.1 DedA family protein [Sulfurimonas sp. SWIR-19]
MEDTFSNLATYGYIGLFLYSLGGGFIGLVAAGVLSFMGKMDLTLSISIAFFGNALGDVLLFWLTRYQKSMMVEGLRKHRRKLALAHILIKKHGDWVIFIQKFIYGLKTVVPIAIALTKYDFKKFAILNVFAAAVWALAFGLSSYYFGAVLSKFALYVNDNRWIAPVILLTIGGAVWIYLEQATKKK